MRRDLGFITALSYQFEERAKAPKVIERWGQSVPLETLISIYKTTEHHT
jgi:hypothetical protein